jgi:hypothetical protein
MFKNFLIPLDAFPSAINKLISVFSFSSVFRFSDERLTSFPAKIDLVLIIFVQLTDFFYNK